MPPTLNSAYGFSFVSTNELIFDRSTTEGEGRVIVTAHHMIRMCTRLLLQTSLMILHEIQQTLSHHAAN